MSHGVRPLVSKKSKMRHGKISRASLLLQRPILFSTAIRL
jgi:hypothetical protein